VCCCLNQYQQIPTKHYHRCNYISFSAGTAMPTCLYFPFLRKTFFRHAVPLWGLLAILTVLVLYIPRTNLSLYRFSIICITCETIVELCLYSLLPYSQNVKLCEDVVRTVNVFYITIIPLNDSSLQADSIETNFVFWSKYHIGTHITCCGVKIDRMTLYRSFSIDKKVIRAQ